MGSLFICAGLALRLFQVAGGAFGLQAATGVAVTVVTLCLLAGGLAVFSYEHRGATTVFALISAAAVLFGSALPAFPAVSIVLYFLLFAAYGAMLLTLEHGIQKLAGAGVLLLGICIGMHAAGVWTLGTPLLLVLIAAEYLIMGGALFL